MIFARLSLQFIADRAMRAITRHSATYFNHRYQNFLETARVVCSQFLRIEGGESEIGYSRKCINTV